MNECRRIGTKEGRKKKKGGKINTNAKGSILKKVLLSCERGMNLAKDFL